MATGLFWRHGCEGTSIAMLCEALGVTPPTLHVAWGSKDALNRAALDRYGGIPPGAGRGDDRAAAGATA